MGIAGLPRLRIELLRIIPGTPVFCTANGIKSIKGHYHQNKKAAAFGCFGWHDVSTKVIEDTLRESGFEILMEPLLFIWSPDKGALKMSIDYGRQFVTLLNKN